MLRTENQVEEIKAVGFFILAIHMICSAFINMKGEKHSFAVFLMQMRKLEQSH